MGAVREFNKVAEGSVARIDLVVVGNIVTSIATGRSLKRHEPNRGHAETVEIIQPTHQSLEVPHSIAVRIHVGSHGKTIDHRVFVPEVGDHEWLPVSRTTTPSLARKPTLCTRSSSSRSR